MKLEVHIIQSFGPSCLNRDATNSPKDCEFGGVRRARISSQCFKRALRGYFREHNLVPVGERTKRLRGELLNPKKPFFATLQHLQPPELLAPAIDAFVDTYYSKNDSKNPAHSAVLLFLSRAEMETVASIVRENWEDLHPIAAQRAKKVADITAKNAGAKKKPKPGEDADAEDTAEGAESAADAGSGKFENLPKPKHDKAIQARLEDAAISSDIALFGRMLANDAKQGQVQIKIDGASQVAHAISTHAAAPELDFFSAVDDLNTDDAGAGMLGVTGFNAACFYRYALLDFDALAKNLGDDAEAAEQTARAFLEALVHALPTGKQNSMAAHNPPSLGFFVVRESGAPCNLANAFCTPVRASKDLGLIDGSVQRLADYWARYARVYGERGIVSKSLFCLDGAEQAGALGEPDSIDSAIEAAMGALAARAVA